MSSLRVQHWADVDEPIVNGVVAAVSALRAAQTAAGLTSDLIIPRLGKNRSGWSPPSRTLRVPSLPLPSSSGYRLMLPGTARKHAAAYGRADIVHAHSVFAAGWAARRHAAAQRIPFVVSYHTRLEYYAHYAGVAQPLFGAVLAAYLRRVFAAAARVFVPSQAVADDLRARGIESAYVVAPGGIACEKFARPYDRARRRGALGIAEDEPVLLCVARLAPEKNVALLPDILAAVPAPCRLLVVGDGPSRRRLQQRAVALGVDARIIWAGRQAPELMPYWYAASDIFLFPSLSETQGLVLCEALAAGLPVVAAGGAVNREILAGSIHRLCDTDPREYATAIAALRARVAEGGVAPLQRAAAAKFAAPRCARIFEETYRAVVAQVRP